MNQNHDKPWETYKRATTRRVDRVRHLYWTETRNTLCGTPPHEYEPAPARFMKGDLKPEVFALDCPVCAAIAVVWAAEQRMHGEQDAQKKDDRHTTA